jgi:uncharacterized Zn finger protein
MSYYGYPAYVSVAEKKAKAERKLKQLKKKNPDMQPVSIQGKALATTWWGKAWNKNLERYADYSNRIGRGRSYVRYSAVLDLKIKPGSAEALVNGSASKPYKVSIDIKPMPPKNWAAMKQNCKGKMGNLKQLLAGKFPKGLESLFMQENDGLFPVPREIKFHCSCPDSAYMCKHIAAALYGIGARLDEDPNLFFILRKVNINDLVAETVKESRKELLSKATNKTARVISDDAGLSDLFGIDLGIDMGDDKQKKSIAEPQTKAPGKKVKTPVTDSDKIEQIIRKSKKEIAVSEIIKKSGIEPQKVRNTLFQMKRLGKVETISRGVYRWR